MWPEFCSFSAVKLFCTGLSLFQGVLSEQNKDGVCILVCLFFPHETVTWVDWSRFALQCGIWQHHTPPSPPPFPRKKRRKNKSYMKRCEWAISLRERERMCVDAHVFMFYLHWFYILFIVLLWVSPMGNSCRFPLGKFGVAELRSILLHDCWRWKFTNKN